MTDAESTRKRRAENPEKFRAFQRKSYQKHRDARIAYNRARAKTKECQTQVRDYQLRKAYGIGVEKFNALYTAQNGCCAICREPKPSYGKEGLYVDHCHATGGVRDLLCRKCNFVVGLIKEDVERAHALVGYLQRHGMTE